MIRLYSFCCQLFGKNNAVNSNIYLPMLFKGHWQRERKYFRNFFQNPNMTNNHLQWKNPLVHLKSFSPCISSFSKSKFFLLEKSLYRHTIYYPVKVTKYFYCSCSKDIFYQLFILIETSACIPDKMFLWEWKVDNKMNTISFECIAKTIRNFL